MPFDGITFEAIVRRQRLCQALREPFPNNVYWNYMTVCEIIPGCGTTVCALGLAAILFPEHANILTGGYNKNSEQAKFFGLSVYDSDGIFWGRHARYHPLNALKITSSVVADHLENAPVVNGV